jgi:LDH2 family malate/lactate/ureidoglycolate dehydrogenase
VAIEALGGALSGMAPAMLPAFGDGNGMFLLALEIDAFVAVDRFVSQIEEMAEALVGAPTAPGTDEILLPGQLERRTREQRMRDGVTVAGEIWDAVRLLADELGVGVR